MLRKLGFEINSKVSIARVVVKGALGRLKRGETRLLETLERIRSDGVRVKFLVTPGGFVNARFPARWSDGSGWDSAFDDFKRLKCQAAQALEQALTDPVVKEARGKVDVITVGIDLKRDDCNEHAELVAVYDVNTGYTYWTGKSYPTSDQERHLVHVTDLSTHTLSLAGERVLVLGCHDLNMFSPRAWATQKRRGPRRARCSEMRRLAGDFEPNIVLHHPHSTDHPSIWRMGWVGLRRELSEVETWASGIGYPSRRAPRKPLDEVLSATRGGAPCYDIEVK